jgi:hypothetical protein
MFCTDFIRFCSHVPFGHSHFWSGWSVLCLVVRSITRVLRSRSRRLSVLSVWNNLDMVGLLSIRFISSILTMAIQTNVLFLKDAKNRIDQFIEFLSAHSLPSSLSVMVYFP